MSLRVFNSTYANALCASAIQGVCTTPVIRHRGESHQELMKEVDVDIEEGREPKADIKEFGSKSTASIQLCQC
ncbi:hypothetical protein HOY80DRAFT_1136834 [Tuber brumale]|nr:hypothetical protein HOY80DRAFT_1136834 [Tuber brumale]